MSAPIFKSPEIDGVRCSLERYDELGDRLSDAYYSMIDIATAPSVPCHERRSRVARRLALLESNSRYIRFKLEEGSEYFEIPDLADQFTSTLEQVRAITSLDNRGEV